VVDSVKITGMDRLDSADSRLKQSMNIDNYVVDSKDIKSDYLSITETCGIFISPDSMEIDKMKKEYGEKDFYVSADDNMYYEHNASSFLDSLHIKTIYPINRYLKFIVNSDTIYIDTKSKFKYGWLSILYKKNTMPKIFNSPDIEQEYDDYLKK
jgi:hypothetical protein